MIEDAMLFALGFCTATLFALLCLPAIWARAKRLVRRRLEMLVPLSMAEVEAERDGLRARAAVAQRQMEQKLELAEKAAGDAAAEAGRRTADVVAADRSRDSARVERDTVKEDLVRARVETAEWQARQDATAGELAASEQRFRALEMEHKALLVTHDGFDAVLRERSRSITTLEESREELNAQVAELHVALERTRGEQNGIRASLAACVRERDQARAEVLTISAERATLQKQLLDEARRSQDYSGRWLAKSEALSSAERRIVDHTAELKTAAAAYKELKQRFEALEARLIAGTSGAPPDVDRPDAEIVDLQAAIADVADDAIRLLQPPKSADVTPPAVAVVTADTRRHGFRALF